MTGSKILIILTYYYPHWTGLTQYARRLAKGLVKKGWRVSVLTSRHEKKLKSCQKINGVNVTRLNYWAKFSRSVIQPSFPFAAFNLIRKNDLVVVYLPFAEVLLVAIVCRLFRKRLFLVHNGDLILPKGRINKFIEWFYHFSTSAAIRRSEKVIIQTEDYAQKSKLLSKFKKKWKVVLPLFDIPHPSKEAVDKLRNRFNLFRGVCIGFAGRFVEEKGVDFLLKAVPFIIKDFPQALFVFAGEKKVPYENFWPKIKREVDRYQKKLVFLGVIKDPQEMASFYGLLDVLVLPSRSDCFPSVQVEAMLCGTPVVAANIPGARWVVKKTGMGVLVEPGNEKELAKGIMKVLKNKEKYIKPKEEIEKIFNFQKTLNNYEKLFLE